MNGFTNFIDNYLANILAFSSIILFGIIICVIVCIPYYFLKKQQRIHKKLKNTGGKTIGKINSLYTKVSTSRNIIDDFPETTEKPYASYSFTVNGNSYIGEFAQYKNKFYQIGDEIEIYYDLNSPNINCTYRNIQEDAKTNGFFILLISFIMILDLIIAITVIS